MVAPPAPPAAAAVPNAYYPAAAVDEKCCCCLQIAAAWAYTNNLGAFVIHLGSYRVPAEAYLTWAPPLFGPPL